MSAHTRGSTAHTVRLRARWAWFLVVLGAASLSLPVGVGFAATHQVDAVEELWSTMGPTRALFSHIGGAAAGLDGSIVIADTNGGTIYRYTPRVKRFSIFDRQGQGPAELQTPVLVALTPDGNAAVYDVGRRAVLLFDITESSMALRPKTHVLMSERITNPKGFAYLQDGTFVLSGGRLIALRGTGDVYALHHFSADGDLIESAFRLPDFEDRAALIQSAGGPVTSLSDGGFLYSNSAPHHILRFDHGFRPHPIAADETFLGPVIDTFRVELTLEDGREAQTYRWFHDQSRGVFPMDEERVLNIITRADQGDSVWEIWSYDGVLIERVTVPRAYRPLTQTPAGEIIAVYEDPDTDNHVLTALRMMERE